MAPPLLALADIRVSLGTAPLLQGAELVVGAGDRVCLVGRNGSGKSTLLRIAAGELAPDSGQRFVQPDATMRTLPQEPDLSGHATVLDYVLAGLAPGDDPHRARYLLEQLGLSGEELPSQLSGGEIRRAALARALAPSPDLLLLDEPTNHLDLPAIAWLERELAASRAGLVLVSHDRRLLTALSRAIVWLQDGRTRRLDAGFDRFEPWRDQVIEETEAEQHKLGRQIAREEDWVRYGVTARRKRNVRRMAELGELRRRHREQRPAGGSLRMAAAEAELSGKQVIVAEAVAKSFDGTPVVRGFSTRILRGDRVGIVGPNGAGKTTLLGLLTGALPPDAGTVTLGANLASVTLDQMRRTLDPAATLANTLTGGGGDTVVVAGERRHVVSYMKDFLFRPEQARTPVGTLSGGERGRLMLACALARPSNLLVLDEPTNDLDLETLDLLQELLADYAGTVLLVSHDRDFLDRVVTSTIAAEGGGRWVEYAGGYSDMLAQRLPEVPAAVATRPRSAPTASPPRPARREKLSFKDRHALETLPALIEALTAEIAALQSELADPALYVRSAARFAAAGARLEAAEAERAAAEERWLTLEMLREELEG
jgi:ATP-binding cassette subfamily F protein uup